MLHDNLCYAFMCQENVDPDSLPQQLNISTYKSPATNITISTELQCIQITRHCFKAFSYFYSFQPSLEISIKLWFNLIYKYEKN